MPENSEQEDSVKNYWHNSCIVNPPKSTCAHVDLDVIVINKTEIP